MLIHSSGILPLCHGRILLGRERYGWSPFSGKGEANESTIETAEREFHEETCNILSDVSLSNILIEWRSLTPKGYPFFLYAIELDCNKEEMSSHPQAFTRSRRTQPRHQHHMLEKLEIQWFNVDELDQLLETGCLRQCFVKDIPKIRELMNQRFPVPPVVQQLL